MLDVSALDSLLRAALAEDVGPGDVTSEALVPEGAKATAVIVAKAEGVLAGVAVAAEVLRLAGAHATALMMDGDHIVAGDTILEAEGDARALLAGERTALNFLIRLSGIATLTARFVAAVSGTGARILDTRKTTPGLRVLERHAVAMGGGENHRFGLYDRVLVKENHLAFGGSLEGLPDAVVEAESLDDFRRARDAGAAVVMLDDFTPDQVAEACREKGDAEIEVSGGITLDNIRAYAEAGADRISIGALTHSAPALDLSMRVSPSTQ